MTKISELLKNPSFCILPWTSLTINTKGEITPCCINTFKLGKTSDIPERTHDVLNLPQFQNLRKQMLIGYLPDHCSQCKVNKRTLREAKNELIINFLTPEEIKNIENTSPSGKIESPLIRYADIRTSNICNLKCRTCSPECSSRLQQEERINIPFNSAFKLSNRLDLINSLKVIYFAGGEPLIDEEHYKSLQLIPDDVKLIYNTNFTVTSFKNFSVFDFWKKRNDLLVAVSLDDIGDRLRYLRHGAEYDKIVQNFEQFHSIIPNSYDKIKISITVSIFNILYLDEIIEDIISRRLVNPDQISFTLLVFPEIFRLNSYMSLMGKDIDRVVKNIKIPALQESIKRFLSNNFKELDPNEMLKVVKNKDLIRGERFEETYPKLFEILSK